MNTVKEILDVLNKWAPCDLAEEWDHVGLQVGNPDALVSKAIVALDVTEEVISQAQFHEAELIITHHPSIFQPMESVLSDTLIYQLVQNNIAHIAVHTNMDKAKDGVNDCLSKKIGLKKVKPICDGIGRVGMLQKKMTPDEFCELVSKELKTHVQVKQDNEYIQSVALVSGGGGDFYEAAMKETNADAFLTGEMKHHEWLKVKGKTCVVAGHYATENVIVDQIVKKMSSKLPNVTWIGFEGNPPYLTI